MIFIISEKAYDKIVMNVMWWVLDKHKCVVWFRRC
jgi:hypothetical protein